MSIDQQGFSYVCDLVHANSGVVLDVGKEYLVEARLRPLAESAGISSVQLFVARLRASPHGVDHHRVIEAMTTNETSFFRDLHPFESLRTAIFPALIEARKTQRALNIWSAACSSGQEVYTTAIVLREHFPVLAQWVVRILATDIASKVLERARTGTYSQVEVNRGLPANLLVKYFQRDRLNWVLNPEIRAMVEFVELNLTRPWPFMPQMDLIFLRNVLIYFDVETKRKILAQARRILRPDGFLLLGSAETTLGVDESFVRLPNDRSGWHQLRK